MPIDPRQETYSRGEFPRKTCVKDELWIYQWLQSRTQFDAGEKAHGSDKHRSGKLPATVTYTPQDRTEACM